MNSIDNQPIGGAKIEVKKRKEAIYSNEVGKFQLKLKNTPQDLPLIIRVEKEGFRPWEGSVSATQSIRAELEPLIAIELRGCVINDRDWMPIEGARITVEERDESTASDNNGNFIIRLKNVPQDFKPMIRVEKEGFDPWKGYVPTDGVIRIRLKPSP